MCEPHNRRTTRGGFIGNRRVPIQHKLRKKGRCRGERLDLIGQVNGCSPRVIRIAPSGSTGHPDRGVIRRRHRFKRRMTNHKPHEENGALSAGAQTAVVIGGEW